MARILLGSAKGEMGYITHTPQNWHSFANYVFLSSRCLAFDIAWALGLRPTHLDSPSLPCTALNESIRQLSHQHCLPSHSPTSTPNHPHLGGCHLRRRPPPPP